MEKKIIKEDILNEKEIEIDKLIFLLKSLKKKGSTHIEFEINTQYNSSEFFVNAIKYDLH